MGSRRRSALLGVLLSFAPTSIDAGPPSPSPRPSPPAHLRYSNETSRYTSLERTVVSVGDGAGRTRVQTLRALDYTVTVDLPGGNVLIRRVTLGNADIMRDGHQLPPVRRDPAVTNIRESGELLTGARAIEPLLALPVFPPRPVALGETWSYTLAPAPGMFPPVALELTATFDRVEKLHDIECAHVTFRGESPKGAATAPTASVKGILLWEIWGSRLMQVKAKGVSEDRPKRAGGAAVSRKIAYELDLDRIP